MRDQTISSNRRRLPWLLATGILCFVAPALSGASAVRGAELYETIGRGDLTEEEMATVQAIWADFGFLDVAELWIESRLETANTRSRPDLRWILEVDLVRARGDLDTANANNQKLAAEYSNHQRGRAAELEAVQTSMANVILNSLNAQYETDPATRAQLIADRERIYRNEVMNTLETNIQRLNAESDKDPDNMEKVAERDKWEHYRLKAVQQYIGLLAEGSDVQKEWAQKLVDWAETFVDLRFQNFAMQYEAQLILGNAYGMVGRSEDAAFALELIIDFEPPIDPPYDDVQVRFTRWLRIQGLTAAANAWINADEPEKAVELFDNTLDHPSFPWHMDPEDPELVQFVVAMDIAEAVARMSGGVREQGIVQMRTLVDRFDSDSFRAGDPEGADAFLAEVGVGLARAVAHGVVDLPAEYLYRASLGFKRKGSFDDAIRAAQLALDSGGGVPGEEFWVASSLYAIGDAYDSLGLQEAAVAAFEALANQYFEKKSNEKFELLLADAAQNWFAICGDLAETQKGMWIEMLPIAQERFSELSQGAAGITLLMQKAAEFEAEGRYVQAREVYLSIPRTIEVNGATERVEPYYRAMAGAGRCLFKAKDAEGKATEAVDSAVTELQGHLRGAQADGDAAGQAALRFEIASIYGDDDVNQRDKGIEALAPLLTSVRGKNPYREGGLRLYLTLEIWVNPEDPADGARPEKAEPALTALKTDFPEGFATMLSYYELSEAYEGIGTPQSARRAAELILDYTKHPLSKMEDASPGVLLGIAETLMGGGFYAEANELLERAEADAAGNPGLEIAVKYLRAKAGNLAGKHQEVLDSLDAFFETYQDDTIQGSYEEAPYILYQYALAHLGQMKKNRKPQHLDKAFEALQSSVAIMKQRRGSLLRSGTEIPPRFEKEYWLIFYQWLLVMKDQDRCTTVVNYIKSERIQSGRDSFAPPALQKQFDQLERDCQ